MARREHVVSQDNLSVQAPYSHRIKNYPDGKDINEFIIQTLDSDSGSVKETLTLSGTHLPFQPFSAQVAQEVEKFYYPGGQLNRIPTVHVLGSMDENVVIRGRFKATKIQDVDRRNEPLTISGILERFVREGNVCLFQLGNWIKYGMLVSTNPQYKTDSDISWEIEILVIGDKNPITGESLEEENEEVARVFSSDEAEDPTVLAEQIARTIDENRQELEGSYLPPVQVNPFSIKAYLSGLLEKGPLGDVASVAQDVYDAYTGIMRVADSILDQIEEFASIVDKTSFEINKAVSQVSSLVSRMYSIQEDLFVSYARVSNNLSTFSRLGSFNTLGNLVNLSNSLLIDFNSIERNLRQEQIAFVFRSYVTKEGDTYQSIATRFYGNWDRWQELRDTNGLGELQGGEFLLIPR